MPISELNFRLFNLPKDSSAFFEQSFARTWSGGGMLGVVALSSDEGAVSKIGELLVYSLQDLIMNSVEEDRIKLVESAVEQLHDQAVNLLSAESIEKANLDFGIALLIERTLYVGILGEVSCFVQKGEKVVNLSKYSSDEIFVVSGKLESRDLIFLTRAGSLPSGTGILESLASVVGYPGIVASYDSEVSFDFEETVEDLVEEVDEFIEDVRDDLSFVDSSLEVSEADTTPEESVLFPESTKGTVEEDFLSEISSLTEESDITDIDKVGPASDLGSEKSLEEYRVKSQKVGIEEAGSLVSERLVPLVLKAKMVAVPFASKAIRWFGTHLGLGLNWILNTILGKTGGRYSVNGGKDLKRRRVFLVVLIVVLVLVLYVSMQKVKDSNSKREREERYSSLYSQTEDRIEDAESQAPYNSNEARSLLSEILKLIDEAESIEVEAVMDFDGLRERALKVEDILENRVRITNPDIVSDLKIWVEDANPMDMVLVGDFLWLSDPLNSAIYRVSVSAGEPEQVFSRVDGLDEPRYLEYMDDILFVYDNKNGLLQINLSEESPSLSSVIGLTVSSLGNVTEMSSYGSNLYFLAADEGKVIKAAPVGSGFAYPQVRFEDEALLGSVDLEINGLIFTLGSGELNRIFPEGLDYQLELSGLEDVMQETTKFDLLGFEKVSILDSGNKRLIEFAQPSQGNSSIFKFDKQYVVSGDSDKYFNDLREVEYDISTGDMYVLDAFRIIKIGDNE